MKIKVTASIEVKGLSKQRIELVKNAMNNRKKTYNNKLRKNEDIENERAIQAKRMI